MKLIKWLTASVALGFTFGFSSDLKSADLKQPVDPAVLLQVLPRQVGMLKITSSEGEISLENWLKSRATRVFEGQQEVEGVPTSYEVTLSILDSAFDRQTLAPFLNFQPLQVDGFEKRLVDGNPATIVKINESRIEAKVLVHDRFVVGLNLPKSELGKEDKWLGLINLNHLKSVKTASYPQYPIQVTLSFIDELDTANNRSYESSVPDPELQKKHLQELEAYEKSEKMIR